jgi:predicted short-subunit dehydrogenase-like oxidoreductase (DUF2520 family)
MELEPTVGDSRRSTVSRGVSGLVTERNRMYASDRAAMASISMTKLDRIVSLRRLAFEACRSHPPHATNVSP